VVHDPLWETHPTTDGTFQQLWPREFVDQFESRLNMLTHIIVDRPLCGLAELAAKLLDRSTH